MFNIHSRISLVSALGMAIWPAIAAAAADGSSAVNQDEQMVFTGSKDLAGSLVWVIISLAIVIVLIIFTIKWLSQRNRSWGTNHSLRSLGGLALGQNHSIQVVEIAGRIYVVGVGDSITLVDKIEDPEQVKSVIAALERQLEAGWSNNVVNHLLNKLKNRSERTNSEEPANEQWNSATSFQDLLQDKLNKQSDRKQQLESLLNNSKTNERLMDDEK